VASRVVSGRDPWGHEVGTGFGLDRSEEAVLCSHLDLNLLGVGELWREPSTCLVASRVVSGRDPWGHEVGTGFGLDRSEEAVLCSHLDLNQGPHPYQG